MVNQTQNVPLIHLTIWTVSECNIERLKKGTLVPWITGGRPDLKGNLRPLFISCIYLLQSKPIVTGVYIYIYIYIYYRPPNKSEFVKHIKSCFYRNWGFRYLLEDLISINLLLNKKNISSSKSYRTNVQKLLPLTKGYLNFCFFFSGIWVPTRVTRMTAILLDHVLANYSQVSQCSVIELGICNHDLN